MQVLPFLMARLEVNQHSRKPLNNDSSTHTVEKMEPEKSLLLLVTIARRSCPQYTKLAKTSLSPKLAEKQTMLSDSAPLVNSEPSLSSTTHSTGPREFKEAELEYCSMISGMHQEAASSGEQQEENERH